jgi:hypothetical protein
MPPGPGDPGKPPPPEDLVQRIRREKARRIRAKNALLLVLYDAVREANGL